MDCVLTDTLQPKKLLYLNLKNQAESQPDRAIMTVNSFVKDCEGLDPLILALAVEPWGTTGWTEYRISL